MESLLGLAFDNLSSWEGSKVKKGLKQIEGLLAQLCLSPGSNAPPANKRPVKELPPTKERGTKDEGGGPPSRTLSELSGDPAFREFFRLQEGFEWNIMQRLVGTLDRLVARGGDGQNDLLILNALDLIQGVLLLHPPSKALFAEEKAMNTLLDLMEPINCPGIQSSALLTLVVCQLDCPRNTRTFERLDGLLTITSLFKSTETPRDLKLKLVEFLYFYLMPESPTIPWASAAAAEYKKKSGHGRSRSDLPVVLQRSPSKLARVFPGNRRRADSDESDGVTRTTEEKQAFLGQHLRNVDDLVRDLQDNTLFGGVVG